MSMADPLDTSGVHMAVLLGRAEDGGPWREDRFPSAGIRHAGQNQVEQGLAGYTLLRAWLLLLKMTWCIFLFFLRNKHSKLLIER